MPLPPALRALAATASAGIVLAGCSADEPGGAERRAAAQPAPAFSQAGGDRRLEPEPQPAASLEDRHLTATVRRATQLRARPGGRVLRRVGTRTEFGSPTVLAVTARRDGWLEVISALLPNRRRGWIPERRAALRTTVYDIRVDRSARRAVLRRSGRAVLRFPVAVGRPGNETPLGLFAVTDKLRPEDATSPYGCCAMALSGHQRKLEPGWPGGDRLAIHGTPAAWTIGKAVSLGCMRAGRRVLERLFRRVPLGAPVRVVA